MDGMGTIFPATVMVSTIVGSEVQSENLTVGHEKAVGNTILNGEVFEFSNQVSSPHFEGASKELNKGMSNPLLLVPDQHKRKYEKMPSDSGSSKRSRAQLETSINGTEAYNIKGKAKEVEFSSAECILTEETQSPKQKTKLKVKRGRRSSKKPNAKWDSLSVKSGLASFSSAAGGYNVPGYGLRPNLEDVREQINELSLDDLLDDSYKPPSSIKDKEKKPENSNENFLRSINEAWSILQRRKLKSQVVEIGGDCGATEMTDLSSCYKVQDPGRKVKMVANMPNFPLLQPKDVLEHLKLPPPMGLDFSLLDAAKLPAYSRKNTDLRLGKKSRRGCLPPFAWSNPSFGNYKYNSDAVKFVTSRNTCQNRWVKMENPIISSQENSSCFLEELESLAYDHSLVPSESQNLVPARNKKDPPKSVGCTEQGLSSSATCPIDSPDPPDSPRVLVAAEIMCDLFAHASALKAQRERELQNSKTKEKSSKKKLKSKVGSDSLVNTPVELKTKEKSKKENPKSKLGSHSLVNAPMEAMPPLPLKKLKLSVREKSSKLDQNNFTAKGPPHWSMPRSSGLSSSKSFGASVWETNQYNVVKKSFMVPPPAARTLDPPASSSQPKPRKLRLMEWNKDGGKPE